jgi:hypothetical protein
MTGQPERTTSSKCLWNAVAVNVVDHTRLHRLIEIVSE